MLLNLFHPHGATLNIDVTLHCFTVNCPKGLDIKIYFAETKH